MIPPRRKKPENKLYIIRKYILAPSAHEAILRDKKAPVDDVWVDDDWKKSQAEKPSAIGFLLEGENVEED